MKNNNDDFIEKEIFKFAEKDKSVPLYVDKAIEDSIKRIKPATSLIYKLKKIIILLVSLGIATTSVVFAKDIANFFRTIFTNSTPGIDSAIKNGYAQDVNMDFVYDNNIGIKVNNVVKDDNILDVSFVFDCFNKEKDITNIFINDFELLDENNKIIKIDYNEEDKSVNYNRNVKSIEMTNDFKFIDGLYYKSILFRINDNYDFQNCKLKISEIKFYNNDKTTNIVNGDWSFDLNLNENFTDTEINEYKMEYDSSILNVSNEINNTNFIIKIDFLEDFDIITISDYGNMILKDDSGNEYEISANYVYKESNNIILECDFGKYNLPENLNLYIKYGENKDTLIKLYK